LPNEERKVIIMKNLQLYVGAIVLGVLALIVGILFLANVFGTHPTRAYVAIAVGAILLIIGIAGMVVSRPKDQA
jgi:uncharacterized membrane protein HdeD (DUF308 family)